MVVVIDWVAVGVAADCIAARLFSCFCTVVAGLAQGLQILAIEELAHVTLVGFYVIGNGRFGRAALLLTHRAGWSTAQLPAPQATPCAGVVHLLILFAAHRCLSATRPASVMRHTIDADPDGEGRLTLRP